MSRTYWTAPGALAVALLAAGCAGDGAQQQAQEPAASTAAQTTAADSASASGTATGEPTSTAAGTASGSPASTGGPSSSAAGGAVDELRDGTWQVGDAGEVEFALANGALSLTEVRPADGWQQRVSDEKADEIEVHLTRDTTDWKFEVELDADNLEISKELEIKQAEGGTYRVGSAGEVSYDTDGTTVTLNDVRPSQGWTVTKRDESSDDIEIDFRNDDTGGSAEFEAEADDGAVELEISQKLTGPIPG